MQGGASSLSPLLSPSIRKVGILGWSLTVVVVAAAATAAWTLPAQRSSISSCYTPTRVRGLHPHSSSCFSTSVKTVLWSSSKKDEDDDDDTESTDDSNNQKFSNDPTLDWTVPTTIPDSSAVPTKKLGIELGKLMDPLTEKEAAELKAAATEIINDSVASGLDEIAALRKRMTLEIDKQRRATVAASEYQAQQLSQELLGKIDRLSDQFLAQTEAVRASTKLAATADQAMAGQGMEVGVWGMIPGGAAVLTESGRAASKSALLGSVQAAMSSASSSAKQQPEDILPEPSENRVIILADTKQDPYAKLLVPALSEALTQLVVQMDVVVYAPTATIPLGGDNAQCAVIFATSFTEASSVKAVLERLMRKTVQAGGALGKPPTQLVLVSTIGTERIDTMPYSMQNLMSGGKIAKRRQIEECIINTVRDRVVEPPLDYTICRLGEIKPESKDPFQLTPFDQVDGTTALPTAVTVLKHAIALQPSARNATLSCVGQLNGPLVDDDVRLQDTLSDAFLQLDGPELLRMDLSQDDAEKNYDQLVEYLREWAELLAETGKGLTTPIRTLDTVGTASLHTPVVTRQEGVQLLFLPTATGKNYLSKEEERKREEVGVKAEAPKAKLAKEGGVEVVVEITKDSVMRVRAKRCNYADDAVIKELSEKTILSRFKDAMAVWKKDHAS